MTQPPKTTADLTTLINYVELWTPQNESLTLESAAVIDGDSVRVLETDKPSIPKGQGIAGSAWQQEGPVIMQGASSFLDEIVAKSETPVTALIAIPVYCEFTLLNVLVFGLAEGHAGLEIWTRDDRDELSISGSYYDGLPSFDFISRYVRFPKGAGLPGACWKTGRPKAIDDPAMDPDFIRSFDRDPIEPSQCLGLPISREYGYPASILLVLSDSRIPLARHSDILRCKTQQVDGISVPQLNDTHSGQRAPWMQPMLNVIGQLQTAMFLEPGNELLPSDRQCGVLMPFFNDKQIEDVLVLLF